MRGFFKNRFFIFVAIVVLSALLLMANHAAGNSTQNPLATAGGVVASSLQNMLSEAQHGIDDFFSYFTEYNELAHENAALKEELRLLQEELDNQERYKEQNESLREMMGFVEEEEDFTLVMAQVIARDVGNFSSMFTIDRGSVDGIAVGDCVIDPDGLVGTVMETGPSWAKISPLLEPDTALGAITARSREVGIVEGNFELRENGQCRLSYLAPDADLVRGDRVETSGLGGTYPAGLLIGTVEELLVEDDGLFSYGVVEPAVDFSKLRDVYVITDFLREGGA